MFFHILWLLKPSIIATPGFIPMAGAGRVLKEGLGCVLSSLGYVAHVEYCSMVVSGMCIPATGWTELPIPAAPTVSRVPLCQQHLPGHGGDRDSGLEGIMSQPRGIRSWGGGQCSARPR